MDIVIEFFNKVVVAVGQLLLLLQGDNGPKCLVDAVEGCLCLEVEVVIGHPLVNVGNVVGGSDGSTHKDRLANHDGSAPHVLIVGLEGIADGIAQFIASLNEWCGHR